MIYLAIIVNCLFVITPVRNGN